MGLSYFPCTCQDSIRKLVGRTIQSFLACFYCMFHSAHPNMFVVSGTITRSGIGAKWLLHPNICLLTWHFRLQKNSTWLSCGGTRGLYVAYHLICNVSLTETPKSPTINDNKPVAEGGTITLSCEAESQSLPADFRNLSHIEYTWTAGNCTSKCNKTTIGPLDRQHNGQMVSCTAKDNGASSSLSSTTSATLEVHCKLYYPNNQPQKQTSIYNDTGST